MEDRMIAIGVGSDDPLAVCITIGMGNDDPFAECIRKIVEGEKDWPASKGSAASELEAQRRGYSRELFKGAGRIDLVGHSTPIKCCLKLGDWVLDAAAAERLASYLPDGVQIVRLIGCCTAATEDGRAAAVALTRHRLAAYGTLAKVYSTHFDKDGVKEGIDGPPLREFLSEGHDPDSHPAPERVRPNGLLTRLGRVLWRLILRLYRTVRRIVPSQRDPRARISGLLHSEGTSLPGLLTEPLLVFRVESKVGAWTLEILFDFECARFYASSSAGDRNVVFKICDFGRVAKTPLEAYLEQGPAGVTVINRHEEAGARCDPARLPGTPAAPRFWLMLLVGAAGIALAVLLVRLVSGGAWPPPPPDAMAVDGGVPDPVPVDTPLDDHGGSIPAHVPPDGAEPRGCAELTPIATFTGFVERYLSPPVYDSETCRQSLSIQINNYSSEYVGAKDLGGTYVVWAGEAPTRSACEAAWIQADLYRQISGNWTLVSSKMDHGDWVNAANSRESCWPPRVAWRNMSDEPDVLIANSNYRIVTTARTSETGKTQRFQVVSDMDFSVPK
jgi:hypothetical protein